MGDSFPVLLFNNDKGDFSWGIMDEQRSVKLLGLKETDEITKEDENRIFQPYSRAYSKKWKTYATIIQCLPKLVMDDSLYLDSQLNEVVTVVDLLPDDPSYNAANGWCTIKNSNHEKKFFPIAYLKFNPNF